MRRFRALVKRYESVAARRPGWFAARLAGMSLLGQAVAVGVLVAAVAGVAWLAWMFWQARLEKAESAKLLFGAACGSVVVVLLLARDLWIRIPPADGLVIGRYDAPRLSDYIDRLRRETNGPRIHQILLTPESTAEVYSRPPLGLIGPHRQALVLGVPLLAGLSEAQMSAVLAHEFSHVRRTRVPLLTWIHRSLAIWSEGGKRGFLYSVLFPFRRWFVPRLQAMATVWGRVAEHQADADAADLVGPQPCGDALIRTTLIAQYVQREYWPDVMRGASESVSPPGRLVSTMVERISGGEAERQGPRWLARALGDRTNYDDSHPSLADRLRAIGWQTGETPAALGSDVPIPPPPQQPALATLFDPAFADQAIAILDHVCANVFAGDWYLRHAEADRSRQELRSTCAELGFAWDQLPRGEHGGPIPPDELPADAAQRVRLAKLVADVHGDKAAKDWYRRVGEIDAHNADANFALGRTLLMDDDPAGAPLVERSIERRPLLVLEGCELLYEHYRGVGDVEAADRFRRRALEHTETLRKVHNAASRPPRADQLEPHGLPEQQIRRLGDQLRRIESVERAYLFRRKIKSLPDTPVYVLVFEPPKSWFASQSRDQRLAEELAQQLQFDQPFTVFAMSMAPSFRRRGGDLDPLIFSR